MATINIVDRMQYQKRIQQLEQEVEVLKQSLEKRHNNDVRDLQDEYGSNLDYVDQNYFIESQYIHSLKQQISILIKQNDQLKTKNRELMEELENIQTMS